MARKVHPRRFSTLTGYLLVGMEPVDRMVKIGLFRGPSILFGQSIMAGGYLYDILAILGRARCKRLNILVKILPVLEGSEDDFINDVQKMARDRLEKFGKEPDSLVSFIFSTELEKVGLSLTDLNLEAFKKAMEERWPLKEAEPIIKSIGVEGLGFGSCFPELTEKIWKRAYESIDMDEWSKWRAYGLAISEKPPNLTFEEHEQSVLEMVATYTSEHYPELLDPLDLRRYLDFS